MFEAKLAKGIVFKKILDAIKDLVNEASWECTTSGMTLQAMDTSHVSLVAVSLKGDGFTKFRCDRSQVLGMNLISLSKVLKCANNDDTITISASEGDDKMKMIFESQTEGEVSEYEIKLMNLDSEYLGIPETSYNATITMPSAKFSKICRDLTQLSDAITITCSKSGIQFSAEGDLGSGAIRLAQTASLDKPEDRITISMQEGITQSFALKYLNHFTKAAPLSSQVILSLSPDVPLVVEYKIDDPDADEDSSSDVGHIRYYLAPKIDDQNE